MFGREKYQSCRRISYRPLTRRMLTFSHGFSTMYQISNSFFVVLRQSTAVAVLFAFAILFLHAFAQAQDGDTPDDAVAIFNQAQTIHEKGDLRGAIELYEKALKLVPEFPEAEYQRGAALLSLGNAVEAEKAFRRAVELRPEWTLALTSLGSILVDRREFAEAEKILTKAIELDTQNFPAFAALIDLRLRTKASPDTLKELLAKITDLTAKANPTATLWTARASLETALGSRDAAKMSLAKATAIDPRNKSAWFQIADIAIAQGDIARANEAADTLERLSANAGAVKLLRANILAQDGKPDEAIKMLDSITEPSAGTAELRARIVAATSTSTLELEKQLETEPKNATILGRLCSLYRIPDPVKALGYCRRANEAEPKNINHAIGYGAALVQSKQFNAAVDILRKIIAVAPDNWTAHANLATALLELQRFADAKTEYQWLSSAQPGAAAPYYFLGITHDRLGEYMDAMANYQLYLKLADPMKNQLDIDKVNLRLPVLQRQIKEGKGKKQ